MSFNDFFNSSLDSFFDRGFFNRPRRYESNFPSGYFSTRGLIDQTYPDKRSLVPSTFYPTDAIGFPFDGDFFRHFNDGKIFVGFDNNVDLKEEKDKYIVTAQIEDLKNKDLKIDFLKRENELKISISDSEEKQDEKSGEKSSSSRSYQSSLKFDKAVNAADISAEPQENSIIITVPKVEADSENVVSIPIGNGEGNVRKILEEHPAQQ
ncbi:18 kDa heat shock protein [Scheffersomyces amazonensis]|uniref:18 kDa heat shock protein n=1 Tax=Scheffersomyces amazonensis TaxID=1078765 RepID=UPI00315D26E2